MKSLIIFDLDGALAESESNLHGEMAALLARLLGIVDVAIISGGAWGQFEKQVLAFLPHDERLKRLSPLTNLRHQILSLRRSVEETLRRGFLECPRK
jgi:phosphomannomutase